MVCEFAENGVSPWIWGELGRALMNGSMIGSRCGVLEEKLIY